MRSADARMKRDAAAEGKGAGVEDGGQRHIWRRLLKPWKTLMARTGDVELRRPSDAASRQRAGGDAAPQGREGLVEEDWRRGAAKALSEARFPALRQRNEVILPGRGG